MNKIMTAEEGDKAMGITCTGTGVIESSEPSELNQYLEGYREPFTLPAFLWYAMFVVAGCGFVAVVFWGFLFAIHYPGVY